ncbi:MAG: DUF4249 domain-containing protein [Chitinophagaceae bacterium]|nr:DUF4249 domain-containing protein [Chitinophagaceae bacterium]
MLLVVFIFSCEKVIDINLNDAEKKYVVEAVLTDELGSAQVLISQTKNFSDDNQFAAVSNAMVTISDNDGNTHVLAESSAGIYKSADITGESGKKYTLKVEVDGNVFTASSTMPAKVNMDTLYVADEFIFGEVRKLATVEFKDPTGLGQNYRFVLYVNGAKRKGVYIRNDEYTDGNLTSIRLFSGGDDDNDKGIKAGDVVRADMLCIDEATYKYWYSFGTSGATGGSNTASPANPVTNMQGGALGYFSAHTVQAKTVVAQ